MLKDLCDLLYNILPPYIVKQNDINYYKKILENKKLKQSIKETMILTKIMIIIVMIQ